MTRIGGRTPGKERQRCTCATSGFCWEHFEKKKLRPFTAAELEEQARQAALAAEMRHASGGQTWDYEPPAPPAKPPRSSIWKRFIITLLGL